MAQCHWKPSMPNKQKSVFISGVSNLLGPQLCRQFLQGGFKVKAFMPAADDLLWLKDIQDQVDWIEGDLLDLSSLESAIAGVRYVIHSAEMQSRKPRDKFDLFKFNAEGSANIANICLSQSVDRLCHISSLSALGKDQAANQIDEHQKWQSSDKHSPYSISKHQAELEIWRAQAEGLPILVLNPALLIGPGDWNRQAGTQLFKYVWEESTYYLPESFDYIDVRDAAAIAYRLITEENPETKFILSAGNLSFKSFYDQVADFWKKEPPSSLLEGAHRKLITILDNYFPYFFSRPAFINRESLFLSQKEQKYNTSALENALNYQFKPLENTIQWTCEGLTKFYNLEAFT